MCRLKHGGFTLIELIMVIIIVAIVSYSASGLFTHNASFTALTARDQFVATALLAQQLALGNQDNSRLISLRLQQNNDQWHLDICRGARSSSSCHSPSLNIHQQLMERDGAILTINGSSFSGSHIFALDMAGNLIPRTTQYRLDFSGAGTHSLCLSSAGYAFAHTGPCPWE